jgi:hypothetical protein
MYFSKRSICQGMALSKAEIVESQRKFWLRQVNAPVGSRYNGTSVLLADKVEQIAAQDQPGEGCPPWPTYARRQFLLCRGLFLSRHGSRCPKLPRSRGRQNSRSTISKEVG